MEENTTVDYVAWVRRANALWIVHHDLGRNAELYLDHLVKTDPHRLKMSCRNAYQMVWQRDPMEDPKPWFYCGLFSLANEKELSDFLATHWLTKIVTTGNEAVDIPFDKNVGDVTLDKIQRLREAVTALSECSAGPDQQL